MYISWSVEWLHIAMKLICLRESKWEGWTWNFSTPILFPCKYIGHRNWSYKLMSLIYHYRATGFSDMDAPWNNENKSCLNDIKFWEASGNPKRSRFWKLQLSMSSRTQKASNVRHPYLRICSPLSNFLLVTWKI